MWQAADSLLVLRDQVNLIAPLRSRASDGLVGDEDHQSTNSDHNPHYVPGVGANVVTALDLTHDPGHGFDSYQFAEVLRTHRDNRIKYVISNRRVFNSGTWTWRPYTGKDPHTNHVHVSVLDDVISVSRIPWNLGGLEDMSAADVITGTASLWDQAANRSTPTGRSTADDFNTMVSAAVADEFKKINDLLAQLQAAVDKLQPGNPTFPTTSTFSSAGTVIWGPAPESPTT